MSRWTLLLLLPLLSTVDAIGHPRYECGEHGRFEYCIDGIPGCIVGCHCHPGYYFDTDTKICEPNAKLVEEYKRLYVPEPTRVQIPMTPPDSLFETIPTPTTTNPLDTQVDAIAKDTDDLGDWLYNQFFKTIENQVINNTDQEPLLTRRSGSGSGPKITRRFRKKVKGGGKKFKFSSISKKDDLRRKLLKITEDDSLFDSESASEDDDDDSTSSDSNSDTSQQDSNNNNNNNKKDDKQHGHRKILMINKKPKPPLPSFIFLPNFETPFYPPIGLPPPPAIPMFPMIPVPPVFPCPAENKTGTTTNSPTTMTSTDSTSETTEIPTTETEPPPTVMFRSHNFKRGDRKKMLRQLRDKIHENSNQPFSQVFPIMKNRKTSSKTTATHSPEDPFLEDIEPQDPIFPEQMKIKPIEDEPAIQDVDFKYLSQLIHKVDPKITNEEIKSNIKKMQNPQRRFETRFHSPKLQSDFRQYTPDNKFGGRRFASQMNESDDRYYANLGQQIASLIRRIDTTGSHQGDAEIQSTQSTPVFNENSYAPRSYWERSVRSPLNHLHSNTNIIDNLHYDNLLNLENKVEIVATTAYPLSLQELENVVFLMDKAKTQLQDKIKNIKDTNNGYLNINLLPYPIDLKQLQTTKNGKFFEYFNIPEKKIEPPRNKSNITEELMDTRNLNYNLGDILMHNFENVLNRVDLSDNHTEPLKNGREKSNRAQLLYNNKNINTFDPLNNKPLLSPKLDRVSDMYINKLNPIKNTEYNNDNYGINKGKQKFKQMERGNDIYMKNIKIVPNHMERDNNKLYSSNVTPVSKQFESGDDIFIPNIKTVSKQIERDDMYIPNMKSLPKQIEKDNTMYIPNMKSLLKEIERDNNMYVPNIKSLPKHIERDNDMFIPNVKSLSKQIERDNDMYIPNMKSLPKQIERDNDMYVPNIKTLPKQIERDNDMFISNVKSLPKQIERDNDMYIPNMKTLPKQIERDNDMYISNLKPFSKQTEGDNDMYLSNIKPIFKQLERENEMYISNVKPVSNPSERDINMYISNVKRVAKQIERDNRKLKEYMTKIKPVRNKLKTFYQVSPVMHNFKTKHRNNKNMYMITKESMPYLLAPNSHIEKKTGPSYFHHELHHFDYFD